MIGLDGNLRVQYFVLYFLGHEVEHLSDVLVVFGAHLKELDSELFGHPLAVFIGDLSVGAIGFVCDENFDHVLVGMQLDLSQPVLQGVEGG
jgi:hypothetical protein